MPDARWAKTSSSTSRLRFCALTIVSQCAMWRQDSEVMPISVSDAFEFQITTFFHTKYQYILKVSKSVEDSRNGYETVGVQIFK